MKVVFCADGKVFLNPHLIPEKLVDKRVFDGAETIEVEEKVIGIDLDALWKKVGRLRDKRSKEIVAKTRKPAVTTTSASPEEYFKKLVKGKSLDELYKEMEKWK